MNVVEYILYALIITGFLIVIISYGLSTIIGYIVGYSFILAGFFFLGGYNLLITNVKFNIFPLICIIAIIIAYLTQVSKFKDRITNGHISSSYYSFSNIFMILILLQCFVFFKLLQDSKIPGPQIPYVGILNILNLFSAMTVTTIYIILAFYSTDG